MSPVVPTETAKRLLAAGLAIPLILGGGAGCSADSNPPSDGPTSQPVAATSPPVAGQSRSAGPGPAGQSGAPSSAPGTPSPKATSTLPPPASTPVPPPVPGKVSSTVPGRKVVKRKSVPLKGRGEAADQVVVTLPSVKSVKATAQGPGEVAGPALAVTVKVDNKTGAAVDLVAAVVTLTASDRTPGSIMSSSPARQLPASVAKGKTATGVYVFTLPKGKRDPVTVEVQTSGASPVIVFKGQAAR